MGQSHIVRALFAPTQSNRIMLFVMMTVIVMLMLDVSLARVYDLINKQPTSLWRLTTFAVVTSICIIGQYFILGYVEHKSADIRSIAKLHIRGVRQVARISQFVITGVLVFIVLQTALTLHYYTLLLIMVVWISYGLAITMLGLLAQRFFSWSIENKSFVIILYALASASLSVNAGFTLIYVNDILIDRPAEMMPFSVGSMVSIPPYSVTAALNSGFFVSSVVSFVLLWGATAVLLHHYILKLGAIRYWMIICAPLVLFLSQFATFFIRLFDPLMVSDPVTFTLWVTLIFTLSKPVGGILFGIAFFSIARNFRQNTLLRNYLIISAFGFVLLFVSNQASVLLVTPFPPFGITSVAFVGLASYLILLGIYSSAISISEDAKLRQLLRKTALDQSKLLDNMATAHIKEEIQKKVVKIIRDNSEKIIEVTGLESLPSEDDLKLYVEEVMKEVRLSKQKRSSHTKDFSKEIE